MSSYAGHSVIDTLTFGLSGDEEHRTNSHFAVNSYEMFGASGAPIAGGVYDLRGGTTEHGLLCLTCVHGKKRCPGHRGHLELRAGFIQPVGVSETRRWLRVACHNCGGSLIDPERLTKIAPAARLAEAATQATEGRKCPKCGHVAPKVVKDEDDHFSFWIEPVGAAARAARADAAAAAAGAAPVARWPERRPGALRLWPDTIRAILERISDSTAILFGRSVSAHPRNLVVRVLTIPPNTIRPSVKSYGGSGTSYHDSTNLLQNIVKRNAALPERLPPSMGPLGPGGEPIDGELERNMLNFQQLIYDLIQGSSATSVTQGSSGRRGLVVGARPIKSFLRNLPRKEGRIRANHLGLRVFRIARSTISGDMSYPIDTVGMPLGVATTLQVEEHIQENNRDEMMVYFLNGRKAYPGASYVIRAATGELHAVEGLRDRVLEVGDILYRDVITGDIGMFNRAPTLEISSTSAMNIRVITDPSILTFRMNVIACDWFNADFIAFK